LRVQVSPCPPAIMRFFVCTGEWINATFAQNATNDATNIFLALVDSL